MGRSFDDEEKRQYQQLIYTVGKDLFQHIGYKKTTVDKIMEKVGIAKGSFYTFYSSKEALFFRILLDIEKTQDLETIAQIQSLCENMTFIEAYTTYLLESLQRFDDDSFMRITLNSELMGKIWVKLPKELQNESMQHDINKVKDHIQLAADYGYHLLVTPELYASSLRMIVFSLLNKTIVGDQYEAVSHLLISATLNALFESD